MMKLNLYLPCRDVTTDINNASYTMEWDTCFILHKLVGHPNLKFNTTTSPGMRTDSIYVIPIRNTPGYTLQHIINDADIIPNKKLIVRYADKHKI